MSRRQLLCAGGLGFLGLNLANLLEAETLAEAGGPGNAPRSPIKSCILMFYYGGPSHHDTWDMKPEAPLEVRGEFKSIATSVPGVRICEHLPRSAKIMDRVAVIRSAHHTMTQSQRGGGRGPLRPHAAAGRPGAAGQRPDDRFSLLRFGRQLSQAPRPAQVPVARGAAARDVQRGEAAGSDGRLSGPGLRAAASHQGSERARLSRQRDRAARRR